MITLLRLSFFDGTGLDFLASWASSPLPVLFAFAIFYLILTSVVLLNGLIGIFQSIFSKDEEEKEVHYRPCA